MQNVFGRRTSFAYRAAFFYEPYRDVPARLQRYKHLHAGSVGFSTIACRANELRNDYAVLQSSDRDYFAELLGSESCISDDKSLSRHNS